MKAKILILLVIVFCIDLYAQNNSVSNINDVKLCGTCKKELNKLLGYKGLLKYLFKKK